MDNFYKFKETVLRMEEDLKTMSKQLNQAEIDKSELMLRSELQALQVQLARVAQDIMRTAKKSRYNKMEDIRNRQKNILSKVNAVISTGEKQEDKIEEKPVKPSKKTVKKTAKKGE